MGILLIPFNGMASAEEEDLLLEINNPTPESDDRFGTSVASTPDGNLLIGAWYDNTGAINAGSAYLFDGTDGTLLLTINNPTPEQHEYFGYSVASTPDGNLLISALFAGPAYLFDGTDGSLLLTINNPTSETQNRFGHSVASTPDGNLLIGAKFADAAYLFDGTDGTLLLTINDSPGGSFGYSVASTPDGNLLISAPYDNTGASEAGSAYLYDGTDGTLLLTLNHPTPETQDRFGYSVASTPDGNLLIGAYLDDTGAGSAGSAYLYDGTDGTLLLTINNPTLGVGDQFGNSVASTPDGNLLIGAHLDNTGATSAGSAYLIEGIPPPPEEIFCGQPESSYNRIDGTSNRDLLIGTDENDLIFGYGGDDFISGGLGDDCIFGGNGRDMIHNNYRGGGDEFTNDGDDIIDGGQGVNIIFGLTEFDSIVTINSDTTFVLAGEYGIFRDGSDRNILLSGSGDDYEFDNSIVIDPPPPPEDIPDPPPSPFP